VESNETMSGANDFWYIEISGLADGIYEFRVYADGTVSETRRIRVDTQPPQITVLVYEAGEDWINWTWEDPEDFDYIEVYLDGEPKQITENNFFNATNIESGNHTLKLVVYDEGGNEVSLTFYASAKPQPIEILTIEEVMVKRDTLEVYEEDKWVLVEYETIVEKVTVIFREGNETGYRIKHRVKVLETNATGYSFWIIVNVTKDIVYSTDKMILPKDVVVIEREPVVGLEIPDPKKGDEAELDVIILTGVEENKFMKGVEITHVITRKGSTEEVKMDIKESIYEKTATSISFEGEKVTEKTEVTVTPQPRFPVTRIILLVAGVFSAVVIYIALKKRT